MARQTKTERQRAQEALGVAQRQVDRLRKEEKRLRTQTDAVTEALREARQLLEYRAQHPALQSTTPTTTEETTRP